MIRLGSGTRSWVGLDIGSYSAKLVALPPGGGRASCAEAVLPSASSGEESPGPAVLAGLVDDCLTRIEQ